jgi:deoxycytidylate deaminase
VLAVLSVDVVENMMPLAMRLTRRSTHRRHAMGAVVVRGGAVLAAAANGGRKGQCAERLALRWKGASAGRFAGASLYVARSNGLCSKPCADCQSAIKRAGIKVVWFVNANGQMDMWRVM